MSADEILRWIDAEIKKGKKAVPEIANQVKKDPLQAGTGFVAGAAGSVPNMIGTLGTGALGLVKTAIGKDDAFKEADAWNKGYTDLGNKVGGAVFGENYNPTAFQTGAAIGDIAGASAITKPLAGLARMNKAEGLARGIEGVGTVLGAGTYGLESQAADIARKRLDPLVNKGAGLIPDAVLKGAAKAQEGARNALGGISDSVPVVKNLLNPRTAEDMLRKEINPEAFNVLSDKYKKPITNLSEWGEVLHNSIYKDITNNKTLDLNSKITKKTEEINKLKTKNLNGKNDIKIEEKTAEINDIKKEIEKYKREDLKLNVPELSLNQLESKLKTDFGIDTKKIDRNSLAPILNEINAGVQKKGKEIARLTADTDFNTAKNLLTEAKAAKANGLETFGPDNMPVEQAISRHTEDLVNSSYDSIFNKFNEYEKASYKPGSTEAQLNTLKTRISDNAYDKINKIKNIDEAAAKELASRFESANFSHITKLALFGRSENAASDLLQFNRNITAVRDKHFRANGVLDYDVLGEAKGARQWKDANYSLIKNQLIDPHLNYADAVKNTLSNAQLGDITRSSALRALPSSFLKAIKNSGEVVRPLIDSAYKTLGYGVQDSAKKQILNSILDDAYAIAKAKGMKVGTENFNKFVISTAKNMTEDIGFKPKSTSYGYRDVYGNIKSDLSLDDRFQQTMKQFGGEKYGKELSSASMAMSSWVKSATMSNLQSFNNFKDSLYRISKTGKVTKADKINTIKFALDSIVNLGLFGLRGLKLPALSQELPTIKDTINEDNPQTAGTVVAGVFLDALGAPREITNIFKEGFYGHITGASSSRQTSIPYSGMANGFKIASSLINRYVSGGPMEVIYSMIPKDAQAIVNAKLNDMITGMGGRDITLNYGKGTQESSALRTAVGGMMQKPVAFDPQMSNTIEQPKMAEEEIINNFSRMKLSEFSSPKNIDNLINTLIDSGIPEERIDSVIDSITDRISDNSHSKLYTALKTNKSYWAALNPETDRTVMRELLSDYSEREVTQAAAEAVLDNKDDILNIIVESKIARGDTPEQIQKWVESIVDESIRLSERETEKKGI